MLLWPGKRSATGLLAGVSCIEFLRPPGCGKRAKLHNTTIMKEDNVSKKDQQDSMPAVKFSELCEMVQSGAIEMDMPGVIVAVNQNYSTGRAETKGLPEGHKLHAIFPMMLGGLAELARDVMMYKPKALGTIAKWWGRAGQEKMNDSILEGILAKL